MKLMDKPKLKARTQFLVSMWSSKILKSHIVRECKPHYSCEDIKLYNKRASMQLSNWHQLRELWLTSLPETEMRRASDNRTLEKFASSALWKIGNLTDPLTPRLLLCQLTSVMDDFMCHFDWATGCPDIWYNIILGVPGGCFWMN